MDLKYFQKIILLMFFCFVKYFFLVNFVGLSNVINAYFLLHLYTDRSAAEGEFLREEMHLMYYSPAHQNCWSVSDPDITSEG